MRMLSWNCRFLSTSSSPLEKTLLSPMPLKTPAQDRNNFALSTIHEMGNHIRDGKEEQTRNSNSDLNEIFAGAEGQEHPRLSAKAHMGAAPSPATSQVPSQCFPLAKQDGNAPLQLENWVIQLQGARLGETPKLPK